MPKVKISTSQLRMFVGQGLSGVEIARRLQVTEGAVSKRLHKLNLEVRKVALSRAAGEIVEEKINVIRQLTDINRRANALLDKLEAESDGGSRVPNPQLDGIPWPSNGGAAAAIGGEATERPPASPPVAENDGASGSTRAPASGVRDVRVLILRTMAEIRSQLELQTNIIKILHDARALAEFQAETLAVIAEIDPDVRNRIIERLEQVRSSRLVLEFPS